MFSHILTVLSLFFLAISPISAHPLIARDHNELRIIGFSHSKTMSRHAPEFELLLEGNQHFRKNMKANHPGLMKKLVDIGQQPPFMLLSCSDSRVGEGTIFHAKPGVFFSQRNIANQFHGTDNNARSALAYAVTELRVKHIIVMGHYGCGGIAAATMNVPPPPLSAASTAIHEWINPIRAIYHTSNRSEIVGLREKNKLLTKINEPEIQEPGFRALIEESVKISVGRIAAGNIITDHYALLSQNSDLEGNSTVKRADHPTKPATDVFIHGWVYDIENGEVRDLGVSVGPPGKKIPSAPFAAVESAVRAST